MPLVVGQSVAQRSVSDQPQGWPSEPIATAPQAARGTVRCNVFNTLTLLAPDPPSRRKVLPDFIRTPEEVTAVTLRRRNTANSCRNTQSVVTMASLPDTGTRNYSCLRMDSSGPVCCHSGVTLPPGHRDGSSPVTMHCGDAVGLGPLCSHGEPGTASTN